MNRLRYGEKWAGLSALALFGVLFMDWFGTSAVVSADGWQEYGNRMGFVNVISGVAGISGWDSLGWLALALCVLTILAGLAVPIVYATHDSPVLPQLAAVVALMLGIVTAIALLVQNVFQPGPDELVNVKTGWWLGLLAAAGVARGGYLSSHDEYLPDAPLPDVEVRPAPVA